VGLGLLGTFIGLLDTLVRATEVLRLIGRAEPGRGEGVLEAVFLKMVMALEGPLTSMGTAFSASMFGLVGSLVLGLMMVVLRRATNDVLGRARMKMFELVLPSQGPVEAATRDADALRQFVVAMAQQNQRLALFVEETAQQAARSHEANAALMAQAVQGHPATQALLDQVAEAVSRQQLVVGQVVASVQALSDCLERQSGAVSELPAWLERIHERQQEQWLACNGQLEQLRRSLAQVQASQSQVALEHQHGMRVLAARQG
jgi:predicted transcriptional regulator